MSYATVQDLIDRYGQRVLVDLTDRGDAPTGEVDQDVAQAAIDDASQLMDSYIGRRYQLPVDPVPARLKACCAILAWYALHRDRPTDDARRDRADELAWLGKVASGAVVIEAAGVAPPTTLPAETTGPARIFSRDTLRGL